MILLRALDERGDEVGVILRIEFPAADPAGRAPLEHVEDDSRIALLRFLHQPPLVAALEKLRPWVQELLPRPRDARLAAVGGIHVAANLDLQVLERRAVIRLEKEVENLATLRLWIINQQPRRRPGTERTEAFERAAGLAGVERDRFSRRQSRAGQRQAEKQASKGRERARVHPGCSRSSD